VRPFVAVAEHLAGLGFSAPQIYERDTEAGFLLIEDLGDALYARLLAAAPRQEAELYSAAVDLLADLAAPPLPGFLRPYAPDLVPLACLSFDWYQRGATGAVSATARVEFAEAFSEALARLPQRPDVLIQRDYHAENLIWLPERQGTARVGLLDFQDARSGHPVYDLVSLLEDARRDVGRETVAACRTGFRARSGLDAAEFDYACATIALQRNLRIVGVFARLSLHYGKPHYVDLIPRVWRAIESDLTHPDLAPVAAVLRPALPVPGAEILARLKALCGTVPTR
jgi:aminoglycoside/choline kinase family phosphotransferase